MGGCSTKKKESKIEIVRLEDYIKTGDKTNPHD